MKGSTVAKRRTKKAKPAVKRCILCGRDLAERVGGRPVIRPAFRFRGVDDDPEGGGITPRGDEHAAGTEICGRHEYVWDVEARRPTAVWTPDRTGGA